ncbi:MAG TPA: hypothetical protein VN426_11750 [Syntrophomonadaceae bacterium]|nr:hypothetical protein [Syntrophomonadaceae bacterium]
MKIIISAPPSVLARLGQVKTTTHVKGMWLLTISNFTSENDVNLIEDKVGNHPDRTDNFKGIREDDG